MSTGFYIRIVQELDEFLWGEEILELTIFGDSNEGSMGSGLNDSQLNMVDGCLRLIEDGCNSTNLLNTLLVLNHACLLPLTQDSPIPQMMAAIDRTISPQRIRLFATLSLRLKKLTELVSTSPMTLNRDTSRMSLSRQFYSPPLSNSLEATSVSGELRVCLNLLFVTYSLYHADSSFSTSVDLDVLRRVLLKCVSLYTDSTIPVRKVLMFQFKLLRDTAAPGSDHSVLYLPCNSPSLASSNASPMTTLLHTIPLLTLPELSDFRAFLALALHQASLLAWSAPDGLHPRPSAVSEAILLIDKFLKEFIGSYRFHPAEIELIRRNGDLSHVLRLITEGLSRPRSNLLRSNSERASQESSSIQQVAKHIVSNYQLLLAGTTTTTTTTESSGEESSDQECLPHLPLVHEAFQSSQRWLIDSGDESSQEELIEAIAEAAIPAHSTPPTVAGDTFHVCAADVEEDPSLLKETVVILLRILLASCRGLSEPTLSPTNYQTFDLDRDHLISRLGEQSASLLSLTQKRNFESISSAILGILLILDSRQSELLQNLVVSNNGCLVLLKIITSFPSENDSFFAPADEGCPFPHLRTNQSWNLSKPPRLPTAVFRSLHLLYRICRHRPGRIKKFLIHYKVAVVLKRFFAIPNVGLLRIAYKLFKIQMRYLGKKWKAMHVRLISCCFNAVGLNPLDDWIVTDPDVTGDDTAEIFDEEDFGEKSQQASICGMSQEEIRQYADAVKLDFASTTTSSIDNVLKRYGDASFFGPSIGSYSEFLKRGIGI